MTAYKEQVIQTERADMWRAILYSNILMGQSCTDYFRYWWRNVIIALLTCILTVMCLIIPQPAVSICSLLLPGIFYVMWMLIQPKFSYDLLSRGLIAGLRTPQWWGVSLFFLITQIPLSTAEDSCRSIPFNGYVWVWLHVARYIHDFSDFLMGNQGIADSASPGIKILPLFIIDHTLTIIIWTIIYLYLLYWLHIGLFSYLIKRLPTDIRTDIRQHLESYSTETRTSSLFFTVISSSLSFIYYTLLSTAIIIMTVYQLDKTDYLGAFILLLVMTPVFIPILFHLIRRTLHLLIFHKS